MHTEYCTNQAIESSLLPDLVDRCNVQVWALAPAPRSLTKSLPFIIAGPIKVIWQILDLFFVLLFKTQPAKWLIVQVSRCSGRFFSLPLSSSVVRILWNRHAHMSL